MWPLLLLVLPAGLTLDQAVERAVAVHAGDDGAAAREIEATRREDGSLELDDVRLSVEHRTADHFFRARFDENGDPLSPLDNVAIAATIPVPGLADVVRKSAVDLRADAARAELRESAREVARDVRRFVVDIAGLTRERALLQDAIVVAGQRHELLAARRAQGTATTVDVDDAASDRFALLGDALGVDDDLHEARAELAALLDSDDDVDDDVEGRCHQPLPHSDELLAAAREHDPRQVRLKLLDQALAREELAEALAWVPWPNGVRGTFIHREPGQLDDLRVQLEFNLPVFRFFETADDAVTLRRQATASGLRSADSRTSRELRRAREAVVERQKLAALLIPPPTTTTPADPADAAEHALNRNAAERRRLKAITRCARAVVDVLSLTAR